MSVVSLREGREARAEKLFKESFAILACPDGYFTYEGDMLWSTVTARQVPEVSPAGRRLKEIGWFVDLETRAWVFSTANEQLTESHLLA